MNHQDETNSELNKKRRPRNDPNNRDFICPCGKSYLSYPALFTHVKQKHEGKPPGVLIKPKNENIRRGRPRGGSMSLKQDEELVSSEQNPIAKLESILEKQQIIHDVNFSYGRSGRQNCNEIFELFLNEGIDLDDRSKRILNGFMWLLKKSVEDYFNDENYCENKKAQQIIEVSNYLITQEREKYSKQFPISESLLIKITKLFFQWLYKNQLTDHVLKQN